MDNQYRIIRGLSESVVDIDTLKNEFAQYLQIENLNFLIGSGCSSYVTNGVEQAVPTMYTLFENFFSAHPNFSVGTVDAYSSFEHNLESMLDFMIATRLINEKIDVDTDINKKIKCVQNFIRDSIIAGTSCIDVLDIYRQFYLKTIRNNRKAPINIFTTNYDLYNEKALDSLGFYYNNGFSGTYNRKFNPMSYNYAFVENMNLNKGVWQPVSNFYNLYKIHGSITWVNENEEVYERNHEFIKPDDALMIYPIPLKDRTTLMTPYSDLFRNLQGSLMNNNSILITLGYSFSDDHINRIILNALAVPTFRLVVFGCGQNIDRLKNIGDGRIIVINSDDKIHYFNRIVHELMPDIQDDVQEKNQLIDGAEAIRKFESRSESVTTILELDEQGDLV